MQIETTRFGRIEAEEDGIVNFPEGIPGFENSRKFIFIPHPSTGEVETPFRWMQCVSNPGLAFPVISPWQVCPDYAPKLPNQSLRELSISDISSETTLWAIVSIPRNQPEDATVNLLAPVLINTSKRLARQVVCMNEGYEMRTALKPKKAVTKLQPHRQLAVDRMAA